MEQAEMTGMLERLNSLTPENPMAGMLVVGMMTDMEWGKKEIAKQDPMFISHLIAMSQAPGSFWDKLEEHDALYGNMFVCLPAIMAVDPRFAYAYCKSLFSIHGFTSRSEFQEYVADGNNESFLSCFRSLITFIQAYFDLKKHCLDEDLDDFALKVWRNEQSDEELEAVKVANHKINELIWGEDYDGKNH